MKKAVKSIALLALISMFLVLLAGCGGNKLVATKETEDDYMGKCKEIITITFKNDKATNVEMTAEFDKKETATQMYSLFNLGMSMSEGKAPEGMSVKQDGKKVIVTMDAATYAEQNGKKDEDMTKEAFKKALEDDGYTVK